MDEDEAANLLHRRFAFIDERRRSLGPEYYSAKEFWDRMWDAEWESFEARLNNPPPEIENMDILPISFPTIEYKEQWLHLYTYADFCMLHNQGIFRDNLFFIDRTGKWTKNVIEELKAYGYEHLHTINKHLLMEAVL